jgi:transposase
MKALFVRELSSEEKKVLQQGLHSSSGFTVRRCQILLSSAEGKTPIQIASAIHCSDQCVREAIHAFNKEGLVCIKEKSHARHDQQTAFDSTGLERLKEIIHLSPRSFRHETSIWTLELLAQTCGGEAVTSRPVNEYSIGRALKEMGISWRRAKHWVRSPDEHYEWKKNDEIS